MAQFEQLRAEYDETVRRYQALTSRSQRAPLIAKADGLKAQLKTFTVYSCTGYGYGNTNGQRSLAHCIVIAKTSSKREVLAAAVKQMRTYKALGFRLPWDADLDARAATNERLFGHSTPIIEIA